MALLVPTVCITQTFPCPQLLENILIGRKFIYSKLAYILLLFFMPTGTGTNTALIFAQKSPTIYIYYKQIPHVVQV